MQIKNKKELSIAVDKLNQEFPTLNEIIISYNGGGDSFNEFWKENITFLNDIIIDIHQDKYEDILWYAIENSEADFNDNGCEGIIVINFPKQTITINNNYFCIITEPSGEIIFSTSEE